MKKILALALALLLAIGTMGALAADSVGATIDKVYTVNQGKSPAETFTFSFNYVGYKEKLSDTEWDSTVNGPEIGNVTTEQFAAMEAGSSVTKSVSIPINLDAFDKVGLYQYEIAEVAPETRTAGVSYSTEKLYLVVHVLYDTDNTNKTTNVRRYEAVIHSGSIGGDKNNDITNTYSAGSVAVHKEVTGNLGDRTKYFDVTVTFAAPEGQSIGSEITYQGGQYETAQPVTGNTAPIQVKNDDTVTFSNVPAGVTYSVVEGDYTAKENGGYDAAAYANSDATETNGNSGTVNADGTDTVTITNNKATQIDTGITLDTLPYVLVLAAAILGAALMIARRRRNGED